jgi:hypothetical protein
MPFDPNSFVYSLGEFFASSTGAALVVSAAAAFLATLVAGEILISSYPGQLSDSQYRLTAQPLRSLGYGLIPFAAGVGLVALLPTPAFALLFNVGAYLFWAVGAAVSFLVCSEQLVQRSGDSTRALLVAAGLSGGLTLTGVGAVLAFGIGAAGCGAVLNTRYTDERNHIS